MRVWHMLGTYDGIWRSRAFANPSTWREKIALWLRGWRPFNSYWWSKPSKNLKKVLAKQGE